MGSAQGLIRVIYWGQQEIKGKSVEDSGTRGPNHLIHLFPVEELALCMGPQALSLPSTHKSDHHIKTDCGTDITNRKPPIQLRVFVS